MSCHLFAYICTILQLLFYHSRAADELIDESGCKLDDPVAAKFRGHVMGGDWDRAQADLEQLTRLLDVASAIKEMKFLILEQKYLENLEDGHFVEALNTLRYELTPLSHNTSRVHQLSSYLMIGSKEELHKTADWLGKGESSRAKLMDRLQGLSLLSCFDSRARAMMMSAFRLSPTKCHASTATAAESTFASC